MQKIKILNCRNSRLWYAKHIGEEFYLHKEEFDVYWTREQNKWQTLNFVCKQDAELIEE